MILIKFDLTWSCKIQINLHSSPSWKKKSLPSLFCIWQSFWKWGGSFALFCASWVFSTQHSLIAPSAPLWHKRGSTATTWVWLGGDIGRAQVLCELIAKVVIPVNSICSSECLDTLGIERIWRTHLQCCNAWISSGNPRGTFATLVLYLTNSKMRGIIQTFALYFFREWISSTHVCRYWENIAC